MNLGLGQGSLVACARTQALRFSPAQALLQSCLLIRGAMERNHVKQFHFSAQQWRPTHAASAGLAAFLALALITWLPGCLQTEFYPAAQDGLVSKDSDAGQDSALDALDTLADTGADSLEDAADVTAVADVDAQADSVSDAAGDAGAEVDAAPADSQPGDADVDAAPVLLAVGHTCTTNAECDSDLCLNIPGSPKVCSKSCDGNCPAGMRCGFDVATGSTAVPYCLPLPGKLCQACETDSDCGSDPCVPLAATKESLCGVACGAGGSCPSGFVCQSFKAGEVCVPQLGTCTCTAEVLSQNWGCSTQSPLGKCVGTQTCGENGWSQCSAPVPSPELCDGLDNDCNGQADDKYASLGSDCGVGVCAGGKFQCSADKKGVVCSTEVKKPAKDLCNNGLDDNCDGKTDEGCPPKDTDQDGTPDLTDCGPYLAQVRPGADEPCCALLASGATPVAVDVEAGSKACDWNCDGKVIACSSSDKDKDGFATPADCNDADATIHPKAADKCSDGIDQDCNSSDPVCTPINDQDGDGYTADYDCEDSTNKQSPGNKEICNAIDDDCDGIIDDGNPGGGAACGASVGACKAGTLVCTGVGIGKAVTVTCVDASLGETEVCNGKDDNCDGQTDETFLAQGLGSACDSADDSDMCANGVKVCQVDGLSLTCGVEKTYDIQEACKAPGQGNNVDENCNGQTDETCYGSDLDGDTVVGPDDCNELDAGYSPKVKTEPCCDPALGSGEAAIKACDKNCDGKISTCDGLDADKDGFSGKNEKGDEIDCNPQDPASFPGAPELCGDGIDQNCDGADVDCGAINDDDGDKYANSLDQDCKPFDAKIYPGAPEVCNGKDDDCDGATDEGNPGGGVACGSTTGVCQAGMTVCTRVSSIAQVLCVPKVGAKAELCNGVDDNCNGKTDEVFADLGQACDGVDADLCKTGTWACAADGKGTTCSNESQGNQVELCDNIDNDCNGKTDEGLSYFGKQVGAACTGLGLCGAGKVVCSPELQIPVCSTDFYGTEPQSKDEVCNSKDDDCDGKTDESMTFGGNAVGFPCQGPGACAGVPGTVECGPSGKAICSTMGGGSKYAGLAEVCDGIDNDCDGHLDEGLGVKDSNCKQVGVCNQLNVSAKCIGAAWQCGYQSVPGYQADKEYSCDGLDNDCDGQTDEDFLVGKPCDGADSDQCKNGTWACSPDKTIGVCTNETAVDIKESCNAKDDNCDGKTDEDFTVGQPCDGGDNDQCKNGVFECTGDGSNVVCGKETVESVTELCNGLDDNCDGQTDEGFTWSDAKLALGTACDGTDADQCANGLVACAADFKSAVCGTETKENIKEICDELDNDCDGKTDEDQTHQGKPLKGACTGVGACGPGEVVCSPKTFLATCSSNPDAFLIFNGAELCDGLDNDCNGKTDDNLSFNGYILGGTCPAVGNCGAGTVECGGDKQVVCSTQKGGSKTQVKVEVCNGKDDDCDGQTDEDLTLADSDCGKVGICVAEKVGASCKNGAWVCDYSKLAAYETVEKHCDGLDNDCDGQTDEGFDIGQACDGVDSDSCKKGTWTCASDALSHVCANEEQQDIAEVCDGADNDCDGQTDEEFVYGPAKLPLGANCDGVGVCGAGKVVCGKFQTATCSSDPDGSSSEAKSETCDTKDNDCDGQTDNGLKYNGLPVGAPCSGIGECGNGIVECNGGAPVCSVNPNGTGPQAKAELCNAKDDDCDGQTDEELDKKKSTCNQLGVCALLLQANCLNGSWKCAYDQTPGKGFEKPEVSCDDLDNDCNGVTDDPYPAKGKACDGPDTDLCKSGSYLCTATKKEVECVEASGSGAGAEICDGKDNDCNNLVDELYPTLGQACDGPDTDQCPNGVLVCDKDGKDVMCGDEFIVNLTEVCDNKDNDCNGQIDEGLKLGEACDGSDSDQCKNGTFTCGASAKVVCENESTTNIAEVCNGKDDDCDGLTDEGFTQVGKKCDVTSDLDDCATGTMQCTSGGAVACVGDVACVGGVPCVKVSSPTQADVCTCNTTGQGCNVDQGDSCNANGSCTCKGGPACTTGKKCTSTGCK